MGFEVLVGGGLGRTPMIGHVIRDFLPEDQLLPYLEAVLHVYNRAGRRDNKYKARIKITVHEQGIDRIRAEVEEVFLRTRAEFAGAHRAHLERIRADFAPPALVAGGAEAYETARRDPVFRAWADTNLALHRHPDHAIVTVSLKAHGATPGDATAAQMRLLADLAERFGYSDLRISHAQNVILPHVRKADLAQVHAELLAAGLGTANVGLASDIIACPGMDYCALATARSIPVAQALATRIEDLRIEREVGPLQIKISGCINACGHHHVGHIGILGLDRAGVETYQITLGGDASLTAAVGERTGPGFAYDEVVPAVERLMLAYLEERLSPAESFLDCCRRVGLAPFKAALYGTEENRDAA
jgi:sulfite reductase (NADPH) hemoprotein beta-component